MSALVCTYCRTPRIALHAHVDHPCAPVVLYPVALSAQAKTIEHLLLEFSNLPRKAPR
jgi:hypothetical protein